MNFRVWWERGRTHLNGLAQVNSASCPPFCTRPLTLRPRGTRQGTPKALGPSSSACRVGLLQPPFSTEGHQIHGHSLLSVLGGGAPCKPTPSPTGVQNPTILFKTILGSPRHTE